MSETKSTYELIQEQSAIDHGVETPSASQVLSTAKKHGYGTNTDPSLVRLSMQLGATLDKISKEEHQIKRSVLQIKRKHSERQTNLAKSIIAAANSGNRSAFSELEREAKALKKERLALQNKLSEVAQQKVQKIMKGGGSGGPGGNSNPEGRPGASGGGSGDA